MATLSLLAALVRLGPGVEAPATLAHTGWSVQDLGPCSGALAFYPSRDARRQASKLDTPRTAVFESKRRSTA